MTVIQLNDQTLHFPSLDPHGYALPMSLDSLAQLIKDDPAAIIIYARHWPSIPVHLRSVFK